MANPAPPNQKPAQKNFLQRKTSPRSQRIARYVAFAMGLQSAIASDRGRVSDTSPMSDASHPTGSSISETSRSSPLDLPQRSYTEAGDGKNGPLSTQEEIEQQRARDLRMKQTAESFVGTPTIPSEEREAAPSSPAAAESPPTSQTTSTQEETQTQEPDETEQAAELKRQQAVEMIKGQQKLQGAQQQEISNEEIKEQGKKQVKSQIKRLVKGGAKASAVMLVILFYYKNLELVNHFTLKKYSSPPLYLDELSTLDVFLILLMDILVLVSMVIWLALVILILTGPLLVAGGLASKINGVTKAILGQ